MNIMNGMPLFDLFLFRITFFYYQMIDDIILIVIIVCNSAFNYYKHMKTKDKIKKRK